MTDVIVIIALLVLWIWGIWKGWKMLTGKSLWLDRKRPLNFLVKGVLCVLLGIAFSVRLLLNLLVNFLNCFHEEKNKSM